MAPTKAWDLVGTRWRNAAGGADIVVVALSGGQLGGGGRSMLRVKRLPPARPTTSYMSVTWLESHYQQINDGSGK